MTILNGEVKVYAAENGYILQFIEVTEQATEDNPAKGKNRTWIARSNFDLIDKLEELFNKTRSPKKANNKS